MKKDFPQLQKFTINRRKNAPITIDFDLSMIDINETLKLEPRHFGAMDGLSLIFIHLREFEKAIHVYDQMLKIFPNNSLVIQKRKHILKLISEST